MQNSQYIEIDGFKIAYYRQGSGESVLFVHGMVTYSFIWQDIIPFFLKNFDTICVDLLGCGDSDKPYGVDYSISVQAELLIKILDRLGIEKIHMVSHDIGGGIAQILAVRYPERLWDLVLINSVAYDYWPVQPIITMRIPLIRQLAVAAFDLGVLSAIVRRGVYHKEKVTDELMQLFLSPLKTKDGRQGFLQLAKCLNNNQLMEISNDLRQIKIPVLIVRGDADPYLSELISERLHSEIKHSELQRIETGSHFLQVDEPELLSELINEFILHGR